MRQGDDSGHQRQSLRSGSHVDHERAVDLQRVHRQFGQVAERGEAGAEVVDGDAYAHTLNRLQAGDNNVALLWVGVQSARYSDKWSSTTSANASEWSTTWS